MILSSCAVSVMDIPGETTCNIPDCEEKVCDSELTAIDKELLKLRAKLDVAWQGLCKKHYDLYLKNYVKIQRHCCDPFQTHRKLISKPRFTLDIKFVMSVLQNPCTSELKDMILGKRVHAIAV